MSLIVEFMIETDRSLEIGFMQVVIVTAIIIAFTESNPACQAFFLIIQVAVARTAAITAFQVGIQRGMGQGVHPARLHRIVEVVAFTRPVGMGGRCRV